MLCEVSRVNKVSDIIVDEIVLSEEGAGRMNAVQADMPLIALARTSPETRSNGSDHIACSA